MKQKNLFWQFAFSRKTANKAIKVAIVVGIILNLINQGDKFFNLELSQINWFKFILTFFVPYGVSTYSAAQAQISFTRGDTLPQNSTLKCEKCTSRKSFEHGEKVPACPKCNSSNWKLISME